MLAVSDPKYLICYCDFEHRATYRSDPRLFYFCDRQTVNIQPHPHPNNNNNKIVSAPNASLCLSMWFVKHRRLDLLVCQHLPRVINGGSELQKIECNFLNGRPGDGQRSGASIHQNDLVSGCTHCPCCASFSTSNQTNEYSIENKLETEWLQ